MINGGDMLASSDVFPSINQQEKEEIQALDVNNLEQNGYLKIYPDDQKFLLETKYHFICDRIKSTAKDGRGVVFVKSGPNNSIDTWIFRSTQPPLFLTFITDDAPEAAGVEQNNNKANLTTQDLKTRTNVDFKLIHSVVDRETSSCTDKFRHKLCEIESCGTSDTGQYCLSPDEDNIQKMIKSFIDTLHIRDTANVVSETERSTQEIQPLVKTLVISSQQQETYLKQHVEFLEQAGFQATQMQCEDTDMLTSMDITGYNRLDLLVDSDICSLLISEDRLKDAVYKTFREIGQKGTEIVLFNLFPHDYTGDDFNELFYQVPGKTRKRPSESVYNDRLPPEKKKKYAEEPVVNSVQIGYHNKARIHPTSKQPVLVNQQGTFNIVNVVPPNEKCQLTISTRTNPVRPDVEEKIITVMEKQREDRHRDIPGVTSSTIGQGSIIIRLEIEPGQTVTDQWLTTVLHALFTKEVRGLIPDGVSLDMDIDATVVVRGNDVSKLAFSDIHKNCVSLSEFEDLQHKYKALQHKYEDLHHKWKTNKNDELIYDRLGRSTVATSSGYHTELIYDWLERSTVATSSEYHTELISDWLERSTVATSSEYHTGSIASSAYNPAEDLHLSEDCTRCMEVGRIYRSLVHGEDFCVVHVPINIISPQWGERRTSREKRREFLKKISIYATSLLNTCGGKILIHLHGNIHEDRDLNYFDEAVMRSLECIWGESNLYTNTCSRDWLCNTNATLSNHDFVQVSVNKSESVVTADVNTKISTDCEIKSPSSFLIMSIMSQPVRETRRATIMGLSDTMQKNRSIVFKSYITTDENHTEVRVFVDHIWTNLRLKEYITSMSKITDGGSFFLGIRGVSKEVGIYRTKETRVDAFVMPCGTHEFRVALFEKLKNDMCALDKATMTFQDAPSDLIDVAFHKVSDTRVVLEVAIGYFDGIVFSDRLGPTSYTIRNGLICRMDRQEWLERMRNFPVFTF